jgi:uncharacterized protein (DUF433 family)
MKRDHHITSDKEILGGKPILKNTRISVDMILELLASGATIETIAKAYPQLTIDAIKEAILYAADLSKNEIIIDSKVA